MTRRETPTHRAAARHNGGFLAVAALVATAGLLAPAPATATPAPAAATRPSTTTAPASARTAGASSTNPHGPYTVTTDTCATCHRAHTASGSALISDPTQTELCVTCHNGTGSAQNVAGQYSDPSIPANDPATASYYSHTTTVETGHTLAASDEFTGVFNRHSVCADCHNPHEARATNASQPNVSTPWTPSGRLTAVSGLQVVNGPAGTPVSYAFLDGKTTATSMTAEYQLCMKCHSGNTVLLRNAGRPPSQYALDKAVEFNPDNPSFHPVEGPGTNQTAAMGRSLTDVYGTLRRWTLSTTSTIRCTNCHTGGPAVASDASIDSDLPVHVSQFRGLLVANYQDRVLEPRNKAYTNTDFALCFTCHTERPFSQNATTNTTGFSYHRFHVAGIETKGSGGTSIDTAGDGQGNAICSECHFRLHSTVYAVNGQTPNKRLVNFAPNVQPFNGVLNFTLLPVDGSGRGHGTCTLVCHGVEHDKKSY